MHPLQRTARIAGFLYLLVVISGFFALMYVPARLFVPGDAAATASHILAHQTLFQAYIAVELLSMAFFIATVLALHHLFKEVHPQLAMWMVLLVLLGTPLAFVGIANEVAALTFLRGADFLAVFDPPQRTALAILLLSLNAPAALISQVFWGLWLLPLGALTCRSGFMPRMLGIWLMVNGLAYVMLSALGLFWPDYPKMILTATMPILLGEVAFTLWLMVAGVRLPSAASQA